MAANQHLIVQDLVSLGAQVNTTDCWGRTPLHVCAEKGHAQVLQVGHLNYKLYLLVVFTFFSLLAYVIIHLNTYNYTLRLQYSILSIKVIYII